MLNLVGHLGMALAKSWRAKAAGIERQRDTAPPATRQAAAT